MTPQFREETNVIMHIIRCCKLYEIEPIVCTSMDPSDSEEEVPYLEKCILNCVNYRFMDLCLQILLGFSFYDNCWNIDA